MRLLQNNYFRFGITLILTLQYSLLRMTDFSTVVKPLPIIFWLAIILFSPKRPEGRWVVVSLFCAAIGDILLDLGAGWLIPATIPFLGSTLILAFAFYMRGRSAIGKTQRLQSFPLLVPIALLAIGFHSLMAPLMGEAAKIGAVLMLLSTLLIWQSLMVLVLKRDSDDLRVHRLLGFIGTCGIVANYILYSINIGLNPVPRDLVIQLYYWGTAFTAWSFLRPAEGGMPLQ
ncbi:MAG: lysoplasmalogenase family protein [Hellea sp.]